MTVTFGAAGATASSTTTTISPSYSALGTISAGDLLICWVGMKPSTANSGSATAPTGYSLIRKVTGMGGFGATLGSGTGNTNLFCFAKVADGTETGTISITLATNNVSWAAIDRYAKTLTDWTVDWADGEDASPTGNTSIALGQNPGITAGDFVASAMCIPSNSNSGAFFSAEAITATGLSGQTTTEIAECPVASGNLISGVRTRTSGFTGTATSVPTFTATVATVANGRGPIIAIRIREITPGSGPTFLNWTDTQAQSSGSATVAKPLGTKSGQLLVFMEGYDNDGVGPPTTPSGFTFAGGYSNGGAVQMQTAIFYKVAGGSEPDTYAWTGLSGAQSNAILMNIANATTISAIASTLTSTGSPQTNFPAPTQTIAAVGQMYVGFWNYVTGGGATASAPPSTMTPIGRRGNLVETTFSWSVAGVEVPGSTGATGTRTMVCTPGIGDGEDTVGTSFLISGTTTQNADSTPTLTLAITAAATELKQADSTEALTLAITAAATEIKQADSARSLTLALTADAVDISQAASAIALAFTGAASASIARQAAASQNFAIGITAAVTSTHAADSSIGLSLALSSAASILRQSASALALSLGLTASATEIKNTDASAALSLSLTASASVTRVAFATIALSFGVIADLGGTQTALSALAMSLPLTADATRIEQAATALALSWGIVADATEVKQASTNNLGLALALSAVATNIPSGGGQISLGIALQASATVSRVANANLALTAPFSAGAVRTLIGDAAFELMLDLVAAGSASSIEDILTSRVGLRLPSLVGRVSVALPDDII